MSHNASTNVYDFLNKTNELLLEMPLYKKMKSHNDELKEKVKALKYTIEYLELINKNLTKKNKKLRIKLGKNRDEVNHEVEINDDYEVEIIEIQNEDPNIKMEIFEMENEDEEEFADSYVVDADEEITKEEDEVEVEVEVEVEEEEEEVEEEVEVEEVEVEVEEVEVEEVEVEVEEVEVEEDEEVEVEAEADAEEEEEADVYEVTIKGKTYYVSNEVDSIIYAADENGDISIEAGIYKNGKPVLKKTK